MINREIVEQREHEAVVESIALLEPLGNSLSIIGQGGDILALSHPSVNFVIKLTKDEANFKQDIEPGYLLARHSLGRLAAPAAVFKGGMNIRFREFGLRTHTTHIIFQERVLTLQEVFRILAAQGQSAAILDLKREFIRFNHQMWLRGIFDSDPDWEPNYGLTLSGRMMVIDVGGLSEDENQFYTHLGIPRTHLYEPAIKDAFSVDEFTRFWRKDLGARNLAPYLDFPLIAPALS